MSKVYTDTVTSTEASQDLILGGSGDNVIVTAGAILKTNTVKDSGGNTLWTSDGSGNLSSVNTALGGNMVLLSTQTASNAASVSFTSGIDSTYKLYIFKFIDINPATDGVNFSFQVNASDDVGGDFDESYITSSAFAAFHTEDNSNTSLGYRTDVDQAQGTSYQALMGDTLVNDADAGGVGELFLFNPASTTYVKHFYSRFSAYEQSNYKDDDFAAGYINNTLALSEISFKMSSGNFDGVIKMYGVG